MSEIPIGAHPRLEEAKAHLSTLIGFDTVSDRSNRPLIDHVAQYFEALGAECKILPDKTGEKANLVARLGPGDRPGIVLSGHTDVVPARPSRWKSHPFAMEERDGRLYGRGSCDMKGFLACAMTAAADMAGGRLRRPVYFAFSHDEEVGCLGAPALARHLASLPVPPSFAIIGEPTEMRLVNGQKGKIAMRVTVNGSGGHSSFAPQHVNAVEHAAAVIGMIAERAHAYERDGPFDESFTVPHATMLTTTIEGGTATNITPDTCSFTFELRSLDEATARADLAELVGRIEATVLPSMREREPEASLDWEEIFSYPAMGDATGTAAFAELAPLLPEVSGKVSFGSEGGVFELEGGIPSIIIGPGSIRQAHLRDEFVEVAQIEECLRFLHRIGQAINACNDA